MHHAPGPGEGRERGGEDAAQLRARPGGSGRQPLGRDQQAAPPDGNALAAPPLEVQDGQRPAGTGPRDAEGPRPDPGPRRTGLRVPRLRAVLSWELSTDFADYAD